MRVPGYSSNRDSHACGWRAADRTARACGDEDESDRLSICERPKGMGGALDGRGVWMARTHMAASRRHIVVRRTLVAVLTLAMSLGQVPTAAFAEALGADAAAAESLADGAQSAATNANLGAASGQGAEGGLAVTVGQADDEAQDAEGAVESDGEAEANAADAAGDSSPSDSVGAVDADDDESAVKADGADAAAAGAAEATGTGKEEADVANDDDQVIEVSIAVIGPDANGVDVQWAGNAKMALKAEAATVTTADDATAKAAPVDTAEADESAAEATALGAAATDVTAACPTAADATEALFKESGLDADYGMDTYGFYLKAIASPYTGEKLGWDQETGKYWQLFVNGKSSELGASSVMLKTGDVITWAYSAYGSAVPEVSPVTPQPDAERPDWDSAWPGYASGSNTMAPTPTDEVKESWVTQIKDSSDWATNVSDPIYVGDYVYIAAGSKLLQLDAKTGETVREGTLVAPINSIARMVYMGGRIIVPLSGGRLQALTADRLVTLWMTPALSATAQGDQQSLTTLTLGDGCVYFGTAVADGSTTHGGSFVCVDLQTGKVLWSQENTEKGYYWSGAALAGSYVVIGDDSGAVVVRDAKTGAEVSRVDVGASVRSTVVAGDGGKTLFVVSTDGVLHRLSLDNTGVLAETGKVKFAKSSTCTPAISGGKIFVGGQSEAFTQASKGVKAYYGVLAVIDAKTLAVTQVSTLDGHEFVGDLNGQAMSADIKSAPVVSVQNGQTYVYFTANCNPGGVYRYRLGDADASLIYTPDADHQNYCMASITVGPDGTLYYVNDSGALFAVGSVASGGGDQGGSQGGDDNTGGGTDTGDTDNGGDDSPSTETPQKDNEPNTGARPAGVPLATAKKALKNASDDIKKLAGDGDVEHETSEEASAETSEIGSKAASRTAATHAATYADDMANAPLNMVLPVAGMAAGVIGLAGIGFWLFRRRV